MNWPLVELQDFCRTGSGTTPSRTKAEYYEGTIPWVKSGELRETEIHSTAEHVSADALQKTSLKLVPKGALLVAMYGATVGRVGLLGVEATTNQAVCHVVPDPSKADTGYMFHLLQAKAAELVSRGVGGAQPNISQGIIKSLKIPLPPLEEQKRIAGILDQADALRRLRTRALDKLNTLGQAIFHEMFGEISKASNEEFILGDLLTFVTSGGRGWAKYYSEQGQRFIRSLDVQMNAIGDDDVVFVSPPDNAEAKRTRVEAGDVVLTITGSKIGRVASVKKEIEGAYISQHVAILRPDQNQVTPEFLSFFLSMEQFGQKQIKSKQYGQAKPGLNFQQIRSFRLPKVPIEDQQSFVRRLDEINITERNQTAAASANDTLFASLQHRAFRGEL